MMCPEYIAGVRQLLGEYFDTMFDDIQLASSPADRAIALSQFTREFGQVQGDPHDENPLTCAPAAILIPSGSLFARDHGRKHDLRFIRPMFQHLSIGDGRYESNQSRYRRLINLVTLTEAQKIRTYRREFHSGYKGVAVDSIWLTHDMMEIVFQRWYRNAVDAFFARHPEYQDNLSALGLRDQFFLTFRMFPFVQSPLTDFLSVISGTSHFLCNGAITVSACSDRGG
jgi:hypothetical protein